MQKLSITISDVRYLAEKLSRGLKGTKTLPLSIGISAVVGTQADAGQIELPCVLDRIKTIFTRKRYLTFLRWIYHECDAILSMSGDIARIFSVDEDKVRRTLKTFFEPTKQDGRNK